MRSLVPRERTVLVVSRGDEQLVRLEAHRGWHFPRHDDGRFAGYHPESSGEAIEHLEKLRSQGAEYLVFPETAFWWLDYYGELREHLDRSYSLIGENESCLIYDLSGGVEAETASEATAGRATASATDVAEVVGFLLPPEARIAVMRTEPNGLAGLDPKRAVAFQPAEDDASAAAAVDDLAAEGVGFLLVPRTSFASLEMRPGLRDHLRQRHRFVTRQRHVCEIYELSPS